VEGFGLTSSILYWGTGGVGWGLKWVKVIWRNLGFSREDSSILENFASLGNLERLKFYPFGKGKLS